MKKLAIVLTLISSVAFAQKHMVRFDVDGDSSSDVSSVDFSMGSQDDGTDEDKQSNIRINYAYTVAPQWQVGITFGKETSEDGSADQDGSAQTLGLSAYYNMEEDLMNTCYFGLHYTTVSYSDDSALVETGTADGDKDTSITLEYGHRFSLGKLWGTSVTYAPAVMYSMNTRKFDSGADDAKSTALGWNWLKFDMLF